jgi:phage terminase large subunit
VTATAQASQVPEHPLLPFVLKYREDPEAFVREVLGVGPDVFAVIEDGPYKGHRMQIAGIYPNQMEVLRPYAKRARRIAKKSGHGVGKTTVLAWIIVHHNVCRFPQKTACTAPTKDQMYGALYAETVTWFKRLPKVLLDCFDIKAESIHFIPAPTESFTTFKTASPDKPEALAGVHSEGWVLLIGDEASGIPESNFEAASGSMSGHNAVTILAGNPVRTSGLFFDVFNKPELLGQWELVSVSCIGHPNVAPDFIDQMKATYGEDSNAFRVRVLGEFPLAEANTVIPYELAAGALNRDVKPIPVQSVWGVDVGLDHDPAAIAKRRGNVLEEPTEEYRADGDPMRVVAWVKAHWDRTLPSERPQAINVDSIGIGVGVAYRLMELGLPARAVNVAELPSMRAQFPRLRDELWWRSREWLQKRDCSLCGDAELVAELVRPTYDTTVSNKIAVEAKKATKKRTKKPSPNRADAFNLTHATEAEALPAGGFSKQQSAAWNKPLDFTVPGLV